MRQKFKVIFTGSKEGGWIASLVSVDKDNSAWQFPNGDVCPSKIEAKRSLHRAVKHEVEKRELEGRYALLAIKFDPNKDKG